MSKKELAFAVTVAAVCGLEAYAFLTGTAPRGGLHEAMLGAAFGALPLTFNLIFPALWSGKLFPTDTDRNDYLLQGRIIAVLVAMMLGLVFFGALTEGTYRSVIGPVGDHLFQTGVGVGVAVGLLWQAIASLERRQ